MIQLYARNAYAGYGIATALDIEGVAWKPVARLEDADGPLVVVASDLSDEEAAFVAARPALVITGGTAFARRVFGCRDLHLHRGRCTLGLGQSVWPTHARETAARFGYGALRIPDTVFATATGCGDAERLAEFTSEQRGVDGPGPALLRRGPCLWAPLDPATALIRLLTESYLPACVSGPGQRLRPSVITRAAFAAYYAAPELLRRGVQRVTYHRLRRRLSAHGDRASCYPVDPTGWLLVTYIRALAGMLEDRPSLAVARWPFSHSSAAAITHDIEPTRYAYRRGLESLLDRVDALAYPATLNLVAEPASRFLTAALRDRVAGRQLGSHGLTHRGDPVRAPAQVLEANLRACRARLAELTGREVRGYRSPRLDRSAALVAALDATGWSYDSSFPDIDRENAFSYGAGVRLNLPYRPPMVEQDGTLRASRCLEIPLTAPDCIQPLFAGESLEALRDTVSRKADYIHTTGSVYVALVHAGVFGPADSRLRERHLEAVRGAVDRKGVWLTSLEEIADWWRRRENLYATMEDGRVVVRNAGEDEVEGAAIFVGSERRELPLLAAGAQHTLDAEAEASDCTDGGRNVEVR